MAACNHEEEGAEEPGKVLIMSYSEACSASSVLTGILRCPLSEEKPESVHIEGCITYYPWKVENKYYTADLLVGCTSECNPQKHDIETLTADAIIFCIDLSNELHLKNVESWLPRLEEFSPSIQLLFGSETTPGLLTESRKQTLLQWCAEHSFEMVEQYPAENYEDDDYPEKFGFDRIREALQIHTWPNMIMKEGSSETRTGGTTNGGLANAKPKHDREPDQKLAEAEQFGYQILTEQLDDVILDDLDGQSFEELFDKLKEMKDKALSLPMEERKDYAEKVAVAFWKALGGDDDEIEGIDTPGGLDN